MAESNKESAQVVEHEAEESLPEELSEALEEMSPEVRKHVEKFMISSVQMGGIVKQENAVAKKITEEHITEFLQDSKLQM